MTVKDVAKRLGVSEWKIYKQIQRGNGIGPKFVKKNGVWFIYARDVK
jgi:transposase